jgi:6,7-dimethyl-8-ribityllumazine synthase
MSYRFAIVASEYNSVITDRLIDGAKRALKAQKEVTLIRVPGSFEIPLAVKQAAASKKYDGIVALGCVLRGETPHFEYISRAVSDGLQRIALETGIPVGFGVLTVHTVEQAMERSGESGNKGFEAATAALEMINVLRRI